MASSVKMKTNKINKKKAEKLSEQFLCAFLEQSTLENDQLLLCVTQ